MPEEIEVETKDLQETIGDEKERHEKSGDEKQAQWIRYIALTTAVLAVFAAIGAMQSGAFVNEAMMLQIKSADTWNEYQADKQKANLYTLQADTLLDHGIAAPAHTPSTAPAAEVPTSPASDDASKKPETWKPLTPPERLAQLIQSADRELAKSETLKADAEKYEKESESLIERHHRFAWSVALIQVAIALAAIAALTRIRSVWLFSLLIGLVGIFYFVEGMLAR